MRRLEVTTNKLQEMIPGWKRQFLLRVSLFHSDYLASKGVEKIVLLTTTPYNYAYSLFQNSSLVRLQMTAEDFPNQRSQWYGDRRGCFEQEDNMILAARVEFTTNLTYSAKETAQNY